MEKFVFFDSKKFLSQGACMLKFLFFEGIQRNVFTIICQGFIILLGSGAELEFFTCDFWEILDFMRVKNFLLSSSAC